MKVIFLDIDGVMNSRVFQEKKYFRRQFNPLNHIWRIKKFFKKLCRIEEKGVSMVDYVAPEYLYTFQWQLKDLKEETCKQKWKWLSEFCNENDIKICVSSVWKNHFRNKENCLTLERWEKALVDLGFNPNTFVGITGRRRSCRGEEIKEWLDNHPEVTDYAILDDDSDMLPDQFRKFHHTDPWFGLNPNHLYRIDRQFKHNTNYSPLSESLKYEEEI